MSAVYPSAVDLALTGGLDVTTDTLKAQLTEGYSYDAAHTTLADVGAGTRVDAAVALANLAVTAGSVTCDPVLFPAVTTGHTIDGIVVFVDSGAGEANALVCHIDRRADTVPIAVVTDGTALRFAWTTLVKL